MSKTKSHIEHIKIILPLQFFIGFLFTYKYYFDNLIEYSIIILLLIIISIFFIAKIKINDIRNFIGWFFISIFSFLYFVRFYWITLDPLPIFPMLQNSTYIIINTNKLALLNSFFLASLTYIIFCVFYIYLNKKFYSSYFYINNDLNNYLKNKIYIDKLNNKIFYICILFIFILSYLTYKYDIGVMGKKNEINLPYKLTGIIFYIKSIVIPLMILMIISLANKNNNTLMCRLAILLFLTNSCFDMLLRNSRGTLLFSLLILLLFVILINIRIRMFEIASLSSIFLISVFLVPIFIAYRQIRNGLNLSIYESIKTVF